MSIQQETNDAQSQKFLEFAQTLFNSLTNDKSSSISATLTFDDAQRIKEIINVKVNGQPRIIAFDDLEDLNAIAAKIRALPLSEKLMSLQIEVRDGEVEIKPTYSAPKG
ncbi:MAG: hypothetical protein RDU25_04940 [Patescibacteria group bacterium]|nr:hypothetical protein [Patescibacteria group bacterium]